MIKTDHPGTYMKLRYKLEQNDQDEVVRIYKRQVEDGKWLLSRKSKEKLQTWKKHRSGEKEWASGLAGFFHGLQMDSFDAAIIERYKNNDLKRMRECLSLSARCGYLKLLAGGTAYSGGCDCGHVHDMLTALIGDDAFAVKRFMKTFGGPSKFGHPDAVTLCNGLYAALDDGFPGIQSAIKQVRVRKSTRYYRCLFDGLSAIVDGSEEKLRKAITTLIGLQKRQSDLWGLQKVICTQAHALYRAWRNTGGRAFADEMDHYLWDTDLESYVSSKRGKLTLDLKGFNPVVAKWIKTLPAVIDKQELLESL